MNLRYNNDRHTLTQQIAIQGGRVDILSDETGSIQLLSNPDSGIVFRIGNNLIPYKQGSVKCTDGPAGRMLYVENESKTLRVYLVEHLVSALAIAGLHDVIVEVGESCYAPTFSFFSREDGSWKNPQIRGYCIPVPGPGIEGFTRHLEGGMVKSEDQSRSIVKCVQARTIEVIDPKYNDISRSFRVEPNDTFEVVIESSHHPDTNDMIPTHSGIVLRESDDLSIHADARPVARLASHIKYALFSALRSRSHAITSETYFLATPQDDPQSLVRKMRLRYQDGKNEHLYHTAVSDLVSELVQQFGDAILKMRIIISDSNHRFRLNALEQLADSGTFETS